MHNIRYNRFNNHFKTKQVYAELNYTKKMHLKTVM